jgi:hypothetical protein
MAAPKAPRIFLSHAWADKDQVRPLAEQLRANGADVWFDEWELGPGDSLVQKLSDGLGACDVFLVVLSRDSVASKWVREELSSAVVRRIEDDTRLIPVLLDDVPRPAVIIHLVYVRLRPIEQAVTAILKRAYGVDDKPPVGMAPDYVRRGLDRREAAISGLSPEATALLRELVRRARADSHPFLTYVDASETQPMLGLDDVEVADAIDLLRARGLVKPLRESGRITYMQVRPRAWVYVMDDLDYDLRDAMGRVAAAAVAEGNAVDAATLEQRTQLPLESLKAAVFVLEALGRLDVFLLGTGEPYDFVQVTATRRTREWVRSQGLPTSG